MTMHYDAMLGRWKIWTVFCNGDRHYEVDIKEFSDYQGLSFSGRWEIRGDESGEVRYSSGRAEGCFPLKDILKMEKIT